MTYPQPVGSVELKFEFPVSTSPTGVELVFGATVIPAEPQDLIPGSATHTEYGDHSIRDPRVLAAGFDTAEFGTTSVELATPNVYPEGFESLEFGDAFIADKPEPTQVSFNSDDPGVDGVDGFESGTAEVAHYLRYIEVEYSPQEEWGTAFIGDKYREVYPDGAYDGGIGDIEVTFPKQLLPLGLDAAQFGTAIVRFNNVAFPEGFATSGVGQPFVAFRIRTVAFSGSQYVEWGDNKIDLWQKYLLVNHPPESNATGPKFSVFNWIYNRSRTIGVVGLLSQRFGASPADVALTGRAVLPPSIDDGAFGDDTFASYRIRFLRVPGYELDRYPNNTTIYNFASTIRPDSFDGLTFGIPFVERLLKFINFSGMRTDGYGIQWASFRLRSVRPIGVDTEGRTNTHYISRTPLHLIPPGFLSQRIGSAFIYARPPITVYPTWGQLWIQDWKQMGIPALRRYPPLIEVPGRPYTEFSHPAAHVSFRVRTLRPPSVEGQERWGNNIIRDRAFTVRFEGVRTDWYENYFTVENELNIIVPTTQYVVYENWHNPYTAEYGSPSIEQRWIDVPSLGSTAQYGDPVVQANTIQFEPRHHASVMNGMTQYGLASIPGTQRLRPAGLEAGTTGHQRMNPRYIFCALQSLPLYNANYIWEYTNNLHEGGVEMEWGGDILTLLGHIGNLSILHKRTVTVVVNPPDEYAHKAAFGQPILYYGTWEVFPPSFNSFRSGTPVLHPHPQELTAKGTLFTQYGTATLPPDPPAPFLYPPSLDATQWGFNVVTERNRKVFMEGALHEILLADYYHPGYNDLTYPIVGDWLRVLPSYDATEFGTADVMNWIRYVYPEPKESDWGDIRLVREVQQIFLKGGDETLFGEFDNTREHYVRPYSVQLFCCTSPFTQVLHA